MCLQVAPHATSSGSAGVRSSGCPESRLLSAPSAVFKLRVAPQFYFAPCASRCMTGFPVLCIFRPCRRSIIELPRLSYPSVPPLRQLQVAPLPRSFGCPSRHRFRVYPSPCIFRLYRQRIFELPRTSRSSEPPVLEFSVSLELRSARLPLPTNASGCPWRFVLRLGLGFDLPGCPGFSLPWRRLVVPRVSPVLAPSGSAVPASSGCPESCIYGWVDDWIPLFSNFASSAFTADESSYPIGLCNLMCPDYGCIHSISFMPSTLR